MEGDTKGSLTRAASLLVPAVAGLAASSILLVDYLRPTPLFCDAGAGCEKLKLTVYASLFGVPTPAYGVLGFLALGALALQRGAWARSALVVVAFLAAMVGALLLSVQAGAGVWCRYCLVADVSTLVLFGVAVWRKIGEWDPPAARAARGALASVMAPALLVPIGIGVFKPEPREPLPDVIARELEVTPKGEVTVIDFADFECPFCRMAHAELAPVLAEHRDHVRVIRKNVPLTRLHPHAQDAARAACCGDQMGKGEAMAEALFSAPVEDLTPEGCARLAASLGLDPAGFERCTRDPATDARIREDEDAFKAARGHALPLLWIDDVRIEGYQPERAGKQLAKAIERRG